MARTIAAIATPPGAGRHRRDPYFRRGCAYNCRPCFYCKKRPDAFVCKRIYRAYGTVHDADGERLDDVVVTVFRTPRSFTG